MPAYQFEALQSDGQTRSGTLEADSAKTARSQLRAQGLVPLQVQPVGAMLEAAGAPRWMLRRRWASSASHFVMSAHSTPPMWRRRRSAVSPQPRTLD